MFWWMIGGVVTLALIALVTALYMWKLYKDFPEVMKAKVVSAEKWPINEYVSGYKYHFKGRNKGNRMMTDYVTYKEKKFKTGEKITVRMSKDGQTCHSNFPMWPAVTSAICILLALVLVFVYVSDRRSKEASAIKQEYGHYIVTDTDVLLYGDTMGLVAIEGDTTVVSTGDYGFIFYQGAPHYESTEDALMCVHSLGSNVLTDGTVETLDSTVVSEIENLGYVINTVATTSSEIAPSEEHYEGDGHDHSHEEIIVEDQGNATTPEETVNSNVEAENTEVETTPTTENTEPATDEGIEFTTEPVN